MHISQLIAECCKVPFVSQGSIYAFIRLRAFSILLSNYNHICLTTPSLSGITIYRNRLEVHGDDGDI